MALDAVRSDSDDSLELLLLSDLRALFGDKDGMHTVTILSELAGLEERPWGSLNGKPITDRRLARMLHPFGVKSTDIRIDVVRKGYRREDLHEAWRRYLDTPTPPQEGNNRDKGNAAGRGVADVADVADTTGEPTAARACDDCGSPDVYASWPDAELCERCARRRIDSEEMPT